MRVGASATRTIAAACALLVFGCDAPEPAPTPADPFAEFPNITFDYYAVRGDDPAAIRKSMNAYSRIDAEDSKRYDARTDWRIGWKWDGDGKDNCRVETAHADLKIVVRLPKLDPAGVPSDTLDAWNRYDAAVRAHEAGHVRIAHDGLNDVVTSLRAADCGTASAAANAALDRIRRANREFDRATEHGTRTGAVFPPR